MTHREENTTKRLSERKKKRDLREKGEEERNGGEPPLPGKKRKSLGFSLELGKAGKLKGQRCWKDKRMGTKKSLYAEILVLSAAIKLHSHNRTSEWKMTLGRGPANAFRMRGALIQLRGVRTSKPCKELEEEPFGPKNRHNRVEMCALFLPLPTQIPQSLNHYRVKRKPRPQHTRGDSTINQSILFEHHISSLVPWDFKNLVIHGTCPQESCNLARQASHTHMKKNG